MRRRFAPNIAALYGAGGGGGSYGTEATDYFAAMSTQPSSAEKTAIDTFITNCKANGSWAKLKAFALFGLGTQQAGLVNMKVPGESFVIQGTIVHTANLGMANTPRSNSSGVSLPADANMSAYCPSINDIAVGVALRNFAFQSFGGVVASRTGGAGAVIIGQKAGTQDFNYHCGDATYPASNAYASPTTGNYETRWMVERTGGALRRMYRAGASVSNDTQASTGTSAAKLWWLAADGSASTFVDSPATGTRASAGWLALSMDTTIAAAFDTELATLLGVVTP